MPGAFGGEAGKHDLEGNDKADHITERIRQGTKRLVPYDGTNDDYLNKEEMQEAAKNYSRRLIVDLRILDSGLKIRGHRAIKQKDLVEYLQLAMGTPDGGLKHSAATTLAILGLHWYQERASL